MTRGILYRLLVGSLVCALIVAAILGGPFVRGVVVGLLGTFVTIGGVLAVVTRRAKRGLESRLTPPVLPTGRWDYAMAATDLNGAPVSFRAFAGDVLVLNFWATWCVPCVAEMPALERLREATAEFGVHFAYVTREPGDVVRPFVQKRGMRLPVYLTAEEAPECFRSRAIPATFVLDRSGRIALRHFGAAAWDDRAVVDFVRGLALTPPEPSVER
ncbi:MAG: TlpA family protein disulfide reductase [Gemmatimonadetes bacterium]|nr:TlpA family protein disulfide reductase [Gemmatimonadota bacterium]